MIACRYSIVFLATLFLAPQIAVRAADLKIAGIFSDHAVLQRDLPVPVWGWADAGEEIQVQFADQTKKTIADANGKWGVTLDPMPASPQGRELLVQSLANERRVKVADVLVGEVWLCSGQSNMAMTIAGETKWLYVGGITDAKEIVQNSANPLLRQFFADWKTDTKPQNNCTGKWTIAGPDTTANFTATGYFFAKELQQKLQIPVGILNVSFGGSSVEGWTSREALEKEADAEYVAQMNKLISDYDNHEQLVADYVTDLSKWQKETGRSDPQEDKNDADWVSAHANIAEWGAVTLPASLAKLGCADGGVVWLRKEIDVPTEFGTAWRFDFPACRADYTIYLNGQKIFAATSANGLSGRPSRPTFAREVAKIGKNTVVVKLHGYAGASGITGGPFSMVPFNPKFQTVPLAGEWQFQIEQKFPPLAKDARPMPIAPVKGTLHWMPIPSQYHGMLHPLIPFAMRGAIWYQGESNVGNSRYARHFKILVNDWRQRWGLGDFPFYACQLPGFGERELAPADSPWAECREMQTAILELPNTGIINLIDTCEDGDLHPLNKLDAGQRLAQLALAKTYGSKEIPWSGPTFDTIKFEAGKALITFKHTDGGLVAKRLPDSYHPNLRKPELPRKPLDLPSPGSELQGFTICDNSHQWVNAQAKIDGDTVVVWSDEVKEPIAVRYGWANHPVVNLYNRAGLPAFPFRSDKISITRK